MGVQRLEAFEHRDGYEEVPSRIANQPFDFALVVAFARSAEPILEQVVRLQLGKHARALPLAVTEDTGHRDLGVVVQDRLRYAAEECKRPNVAIAELPSSLLDSRPRSRRLSAASQKRRSGSCALHHR